MIWAGPPLFAKWYLLEKRYVRKNLPRVVTLPLVKIKGLLLKKGDKSGLLSEKVPISGPLHSLKEIPKSLDLYLPLIPRKFNRCS